MNDHNTVAKKPETAPRTPAWDLPGNVTSEELMNAIVRDHLQYAADSGRDLGFYDLPVDDIVVSKNDPFMQIACDMLNIELKDINDAYYGDWRIPEVGKDDPTPTVDKWMAGPEGIDNYAVEVHVYATTDEYENQRLFAAITCARQHNLVAFHMRNGSGYGVKQGFTRSYDLKAGQHFDHNEFMRLGRDECRRIEYGLQELGTRRERMAANSEARPRVLTKAEIFKDQILSVR